MERFKLDFDVSGQMGGGVRSPFQAKMTKVSRCARVKLCRLLCLACSIHVEGNPGVVRKIHRNLEAWFWGVDFIL